ncbi:MAG: hypothetical protein HW373_1702, partial [Deltaproteobacteria bacterium]|nr:hypothetical protein [Deltaproteobacteria bacterium]
AESKIQTNPSTHDRGFSFAVRSVSYSDGAPSTPSVAGGSRSGFRPTGVVEGAMGLPVGLHTRQAANLVPISS